MKNLFIVILISSALYSHSQSGKSKNLKIKWDMPAGWNVEEFGDKNTWETGNHPLCRCAGIIFFKSDKAGKMNVVLYPSTQSGLDSAKRNAVGNLRFEDVVKYDKVRLNELPFERKKSNFADAKSGAKSFEAYRFYIKQKDTHYIIYAWQENMQSLNSTAEKDLFAMVKAIEID
jgi:hypothetical protein